MKTQTLPRRVVLTCCFPLNASEPQTPYRGFISSLAGEPADLLALSAAYAIVAYRGEEYLVPRRSVLDLSLSGPVPVAD